MKTFETILFEDHKLLFKDLSEGMFKKMISSHTSTQPSKKKEVIGYNDLLLSA